MNLDRRGIDRLQIAIVSFCNLIENAVPYADLSPPDEAIVAGRRRSIALWNISPGRAGAQPPEDAVQNLAVIDPRHAARLVRQLFSPAV